MFIITTSTISEQLSNNQIIVNEVTYEAQINDLVLDSAVYEYKWNGSQWDLIGNGTNSSPFIVHDWTEFGSVNTSANQGKYIRFADIHVENGDWAISGSGRSAADPCVVSTYREMLHATGAANIHLCKCINKNLPNEERLYRYDEEDPETHEVTSTYCRYNPAPSTIDYNDISTGYRSEIYIWTHVNFNGWTLQNFKIQVSSNSNSAYQRGFFGFNSNMGLSNSQVEVYNVIIANAQLKAVSVDPCLFPLNIHDSIVQIVVDYSNPPAGSDPRIAIYYSGSYGCGFARNALTLKIFSSHSNGAFICGHENYGAVNVEDSIIDLDIDIPWYSTAWGSKFQLVRSVMKGKYKYSSYRGNLGSTGLIGSCIDSIYDVEHISTIEPPYPTGNSTHCIFNNDDKESPAIKTNWNRTGWTGVTSAQLLSPSWLQEYTDFPIGVDNNA